jgi:hypothetical protein
MFQEDLSHYVVAVHIDKQDAQTIARLFVQKVVLLYGTAQIVQTDRGDKFLSEGFRNSYNLLKIMKVQSTALQQQSKGGIERSDRVLAEYLRHYVREEKTDWYSWVPFTTYVYNTQHSATSFNSV